MTEWPVIMAFLAVVALLIGLAWWVDRKLTAQTEALERECAQWMLDYIGQVERDIDGRKVSK